MIPPDTEKSQHVQRKFQYRVSGLFIFSSCFKLVVNELTQVKHKSLMSIAITSAGVANENTRDARINEYKKLIQTFN